MDEMHDGISVAELLRIFFRRINWIILVTVIVVGLGFIYITSRPPIYEASVKLEVEGLQNLGSDIPTFLLAPINSAGSSITFEFNNARVPVKDLTKELEYVTTSKTITNALEGLNLRQFPAIYAQYTTDTDKLVKSISQKGRMFHRELSVYTFALFRVSWMGCFYILKNLSISAMLMNCLRHIGMVFASLAPNIMHRKIRYGLKNSTTI